MAFESEGVSAEMQDYRKVVLSPAARTLEQRWLQIRMRADVQAALAEVGRIDQDQIQTVS